MLLALRLIYEDYSKIITPSAGSIYLKLLFINKNLLENKKSKNLPSITYDQVTSNMKVSADEVHAACLLLDALGLVSMLARKEAVYVNPPKELSYEESVSLIERLVEKRIIEQDQKQVHMDAIRPKDKKTKSPKTVKPVDYDFENVGAARIKASPYTHAQAAIVVDHYYDKLSQTFGGVFASPAKSREISLIRAHMNRFGDTPDMTMKMLDYMIERAKGADKFSEVCTMSLYGWKRNVIFNKLFEGKQEPKIVTSQDKLSSMKVLYDIYVEDGMSHAEATRELRMAFGDESTKQFEEGLHGKQVSIHQRAV